MRNERVKELTREEAITILDCERPYGSRGCGATDEEIEEALNRAIKALEQESVLDKIEEEIKDTLYVDSLIFTEMIDFKNGKISADDVIEEFNRVTRTEILKIIDKHKIESIGEIKGE